MSIIQGQPLALEKSLFSIAVVVSRFNEAVTTRLLEGALTRAKAMNLPEPWVIWVPGAIEIPLIVQRLAKNHSHDAIVALGAVIRGETSHYDYVCQQVSQGCQQIGLTHDIPVIFGVLTTENEEQALERAGGVHGNKGADAMDTACEMISVLRKLEGYT